MESLVFAIGRFNPPTIGHEEMIKKVISVSKQNSIPFVVFTTRTQDRKRNPLDVGTKMSYLKAAFPGVYFVDVDNIIDAIAHVDDLGVKHVIVVAGSDRLYNYVNLIQKGIDSKHLNNIIDISSVELSRDADSDDVRSASATNSRLAAANGDFDEFMKLSPSRLNKSLIKQMYRSVREGMGVK